MRPYLRHSYFLPSLVLATVLLGIAAPRLSAECTPYWKSSQTLDLPDLGGIVAADFNNDGVPDLGLTTYSRTLVSLTNPVTRELGSPVDLLLRSGTGDPLAGDFTGDGVVDLVVRSSVAKTFSTFSGNGDGTFDEEVLTVAPMQPGRFVSGYFNADSELDLAVLSFDGTLLSLWAGNGAGGFSSTTQANLPTAGRGLVAIEITGDEHRDVLVASSGGLLLFAGNGDGTLQTAASVAVGNFNTLAAADMDGDGDIDAVTTSDETAMLSVHLNDGNGAFPSVSHHSTRLEPGHTGIASSIYIGHVTDDAMPDVVLMLDDDSMIATFVGAGDGSFAPVSFRYTTFGGIRAALADIDGDGRIDLIYRAWDADLALNNCGDVSVIAQAVTPIVSVGDHLRVTASMSNGINDAPSGEISIVQGEVALATAHVTTSPSADIELPLLPAGAHAFKAVFEGSSSFHPAESSAFSAVVTEETTTTTVAVTTPAEEIVFGNSVHLEASVTSTLPGTPEGLMRFSIDGVQQPTGNCCSYSWYRPHAGEHTVRAEYLGSATHPPSISDAITVTVAKAASTVQLLVNVSSTVGEQITIYITPDRAGEIKLYDGTIELFSGTANGFDPVPFITSLAPGTHRLLARYVGTTDYLPSEQTAEHTVLAPGSISIDAHADGNAIHLLWRSSQPALRYFEVRFLSGGLWQTAATGEVQAGQPASGVFWFNDVTANDTRVFQMIGWDSSWTPLSPSNVDAASVATFLDETLTPGVTAVKSQHFTDVLDGINRLRAASAGSPLAMPGLAAGNLVRYVDLITLRQKANEARWAVGMQEYPFTDRGSSRTILVRDIEELRHAVR